MHGKWLQFSCVNEFPRITANFAISADGKISDEHHRPSGWTSREDHARLGELRRGADALLVGRRTLVADRMTLCVSDQEWQPLRCVVTRGGELTGEEPLFHRAGGPIHILRADAAFLPDRKDVTIHQGGLGDFLRSLHQQHGVNHLHCEGGGGLMKSIIEICPPELIYVTWAAHTLFGGGASPTIAGVPLPQGIHGLQIPSSLRYHLKEARPSACGQEMFLTWERR